MNLRISATYPATDGSMPESVEAEWAGIEPGGADADLVQTVLGMLLRAPASRMASPVQPASQGVITTGGYVAGSDLVGGQPVAFGGDGFTVYPADSPEATSIHAGISGGTIRAGSRLEHTRIGELGWSWTKARETR